MAAEYASSRAALEAARDTLSAAADAVPLDKAAVDGAVEAADAAVKALETAAAAAKKKPADYAELVDAVKKLIEAASAKAAEAAEVAKKRKAEAKKKVMQEVQRAALLTGDLEALEAVVAEGQAAELLPKEIAEAEARLHEMQTFHFTLRAAADELREVSTGDALTLAETEGGLAALEEKIAEHKEGAVATLDRVVLEEYLKALTKPSATNIATDELQAQIDAAVALGMDEATVIKPMKKKKDEAVKAQNAQKIADRKAKKPPKDPPAPPERPEAHPTVAVLQGGLSDALAQAQAKLLEAQTSLALKQAMQPQLLTGDALLDLEAQPNRDEPHAHIDALSKALAAATDAKAISMLLLDGQKALDDAVAVRFAARTALALSKMQAAMAAAPIACDVAALGACIATAEKEAVDEEALSAARKHHLASFKAQSEGALEPLSRPQELSHEGFEIIDPLKVALDEARKRGASEDLLIKGQAKLDYWIEARARRDKAKKELDAALAPPPSVVEQPKVTPRRLDRPCPSRAPRVTLACRPQVHACLSEAADAKLDPNLLKEAVGKLRVAELAQRVYERSKEPPGTLAIGELQAELEEVRASAPRPPPQGPLAMTPLPMASPMPSPNALPNALPNGLPNALPVA